jgi:N-acetylmuramoyl-L-alanine amidase
MASGSANGFTMKGDPFLPESSYARRQGTKYLVVHCSDTRSHIDVDIGMIREWHMKERGWADVGYHYVIRRNGLIENGRPHWALGAGVQGYNSHSMHVCLVGGRGPNGKAENNFTPEQFRSLKFILANLLTREAVGAEVCGHRDFPNTGKECPSFNVKPWWAEHKAAAFKLLEEKPC